LSVIILKNEYKSYDEDGRILRRTEKRWLVQTVGQFHSMPITSEPVARQLFK